MHRKCSIHLLTGKTVAVPLFLSCPSFPVLFFLSYVFNLGDGVEKAGHLMLSVG
jgi:hypothetical protein